MHQSFSIAISGIFIRFLLKRHLTLLTVGPYLYLKRCFPEFIFLIFAVRAMNLKAFISLIDRRYDLNICHVVMVM